MIKVPILETLKQNDSTVYHFSESNNDLLKMMTSKTSRRVPSKFVCLKLPNWQNLSGAARQLFIDPTEFSASPLITDPNQLVPALLQNYLENIVAYAKTEQVFDDKLTEFAFWKMLQLAGSIDAQPIANDQQGRYEDNWGDDLIQYIGDINILNHAEYKDEEYSEMYLHIPHDAQRVRNTKFLVNAQSMSNVLTLPQTPPAATESLGLSGSSITLKNAILDKDSQGAILNHYEMSKASDKLTLDFNDFDKVTEQIEYNAILIYYDVYLDSQPTVATRKLGGIVFVDDFKQELSAWVIESAIKQYNTQLVTGNSIVHRINSRFFYGNNTIDVQSVVNQYNSISMDLYVDALRRLVEISSSYESLKDKMAILEQKLVNFSKFEMSIQDVNAAMQKFASLETQLSQLTSGNTQATQITTQELLDAFDQLVTQMSNANGSTFNNTFIFGLGATISDFEAFYVSTQQTSNLRIVKYSNESFLSNAIYRTYIKSKYSVIGELNAQQLDITVKSLDGAAMTAYYYDLQNQAQSTVQLNSQYTISLNFAQNSSTKQKALVYDTNTNQIKVIDLEIAMNTEYLTSIVIATFHLPTLAEFNANLLQFYVPAKSLPNFDETEFSNVNGQLRNTLKNVLLQRLMFSETKVLNPLDITTASGTIVSAGDAIDLTITDNTPANIMVIDKTALVQDSVATKTISIPLVQNLQDADMYVVFIDTSFALSYIPFKTLLLNNSFAANLAPLCLIYVTTQAEMTTSNYVSYIHKL